MKTRHLVFFHRIFASLVVCCLVISLLPIFSPSVSAFAGGSGTVGDPYQIGNWTHLYDVRNYLSSYFILINDLNYTIDGYVTYASTTADGGAGWDPISRSSPYFSGVFNGQNYSISDLYVSRAASDYIGIFGRTNTATIKFLTVTNITITGRDSTGGLIGLATSGSISNVSVNGTVTGRNYVGGIGGYYTTSISVSLCRTNVSVTGSSYVGGVIGYLQGSCSVSRSSSKGDVTGVDNTGGFVGINFQSSSVLNCYAMGNVSRSSGAATSIGGFCGTNFQSSLMYSWSNGTVFYVGVGHPTTKGFVGSQTTGGGYADTGNFFDTDTSLQTSTTGNAVGKNTTAMKTRATYSSVSWNIGVNETDANNGYSYLAAAGGTYIWLIPDISPSSFTASMVNATRINVSWVPASGYNTTVRYKLGGYPTDPTDGSELYNGSGSYYLKTDCIPSKQYYFRAWGFKTVIGSINWSAAVWTAPEIPTGVSYLIKSGVTFINISWTNGTGSTNTTVQRSATSQPTTPWSGTQIANTTVGYYNMSGLTQPYYFTLFSWNTTTGLYSVVGVNVSWYVVWFKCYNISSGLPITGYNIFLTNSSGSQTYNASNCNNPHLINATDCPHGVVTVVVSKWGYSTTQFSETITSTSIHYINAYLSPLVSPPVGNGSYLYMITVVDEASLTIDDVSVNVKGIVNGSFVTVSQGYTDGNGQFSVYLVPDKFYKVTLTKDGYDTSYNDYIPTSSVFTVTFKMHLNDSSITQYLWYEEHLFNGYMDNTTSILYVNYTDYMSETEKWDLFIYMIGNGSTMTLVASYLAGTNQTFQMPYKTSNVCDYHVVIWVNHTTFGRVSDEFTVYGYHGGFLTGKAAKFNLLMSNFAWNPFGWANTAGLFLILISLFSFGRRESYMSALLVGGILLFLDLYIGFNTTWANLAGCMFPAIVLFIGILMMIRDRGMFGAS